MEKCLQQASWLHGHAQFDLVYNCRHAVESIGDLCKQRELSDGQATSDAIGKCLTMPMPVLQCAASWYLCQKELWQLERNPDEEG